MRILETLKGEAEAIVARLESAAKHELDALQRQFGARLEHLKERIERLAGESPAPPPPPPAS